MSEQPFSNVPTAKGSQVIKAGFLRRFKKGFLSKGFKDVYVELTLDSHLVWFRDQCSYKQDGCIYLTSVCDFLAVGPYTRSIPCRPSLPRSASERHVIAIPSTPGRNSTVYWFLASSDNELNEWMTTISSVLPPLPPPKDSSQTCPREPPPPYTTAPDDERKKEQRTSSLEARRFDREASSNQTVRPIRDDRREDCSTDIVASAATASSWGWTWGWGGGWGCGGWGCFEYGPNNHQFHPDHVHASELGADSQGGDSLRYGGDGHGDCAEASYANAADYDHHLDLVDMDNGGGYNSILCDGGGGFDAGFDVGGFDMGFSIGF